MDGFSRGSSKKDGQKSWVKGWIEIFMLELSFLRSQSDKSISHRRVSQIFKLLKRFKYWFLKKLSLIKFQFINKLLIILSLNFFVYLSLSYPLIIHFTGEWSTLLLATFTIHPPIRRMDETTLNKVEYESMFIYPNFKKGGVKGGL